MDWSQFDLAMRDPRYLRGAAVFRDEPRMPVQRYSTIWKTG